MKTYECKKCRLRKHVDEFIADKANRNGLKAWCITCVRGNVSFSRRSSMLQAINLSPRLSKLSSSFALPVFAVDLEDLESQLNYVK